MNAQTANLKATLERSRVRAQRHGPKMTADQRESRHVLRALMNTRHNERHGGSVSAAISAHDKAFRTNTPNHTISPSGDGTWQIADASGVVIADGFGCAMAAVDWVDNQHTTKEPIA